jgi:hypothetical protein
VLLLSNILIDLLLPKTDRLVFIEMIVVSPIFAFWIFKAWANKDHRLLAIGASIFTLAWFALRTLH